MESGLSDFWFRFGSVTGLFKPAPSPKPCQKPKILAAPRYIFSINAPGMSKASAAATRQALICLAGRILGIFNAPMQKRFSAVVPVVRNRFRNHS
jgi:hypothetical protein